MEWWQEKNKDVLTVKDIYGEPIGYCLFSKNEKSAEEIVVLNDLYEKLSGETKEALELLFSDEYEEYSKEVKYNCTIKNKVDKFLRKYMKKNGLKYRMVERVFKELKQFKSFIDDEFLISFLKCVL